MASIRMTFKTGLSMGSVMEKKVRTPLAPSILADSYTSSEMPLMPLMKYSM